MQRSMMVLLALLLAFPLTGCATVVSADFDVVARPTECSLLAPQTADGHTFVRCDAASTCVATPEGKASCMALAAAGDEGASCAAQNECAPGLTCAEQFGCLRACDVGGVCSDGSTCNPFASDAPLMAGGNEYGYCTPPSCDPLDPLHPGHEGLVACPNDECHFTSASGTACFPPSKGQRRAASGVACRDDRDCSTGNSCFEGRCSMLCRVGRSDCVDGWACVEGASDVGVPVLAGETYGHCE